MTQTPRATIDFETRSAASLKACGPWRYSIDPSTSILCMAFRLPYWEPGRTGLWHPAFPSIGMPERFDQSDLTDLVEWIDAGNLLEAHNVWFEKSIWHNILTPRFDWPLPAVSQWRCSAAKASAHALPRKLDLVTQVLRLKVKKDAEGHKLMLKLSKPRKSRKAEREAWQKAGVTPPSVLWHESVDQFERLFAYCRQDVLAEEGVSHALPDLNPHETDLFIMDGEMNAQGFQLDERGVKRALVLLEDESRILNAELFDVTDGYIAKATQRENMKVWLESRGLKLYDTQAATLDEILKRGPEGIDARAYRALTLMRALGRSSTAKYEAMNNWAGSDWRVRGGLLYHGASTGRWSGAGVQPHNFPKLSPTPLGAKPSTTDMGTLWQHLLTDTREGIASTYGGVMEALSAGLRGAIVAPEGKVLYVADFASIEARVLLWLAGDEAGLQMFRDHIDPYCDMAADIYHYPVNKKDHPDERSIGKFAILGLGYQMGPDKFLDTCEKYGVIITHEFSEQVVDAYRTKYWRVKQLWYDMEEAACTAVVSRAPVSCYNVKWFVQGRFLYCELPSGRRLAYPDPQVKPKMMPWGKVKDTLSYMGVNPVTHQWTRQTVYGGLLVENIVQAESRDLMADGMLRARKSGIYDVVLSVHDELVAEADEGTGSVKEFEALMAECPPWATGCPVEAEGWTGTRYRK